MNPFDNARGNAPNPALARDFLNAVLDWMVEVDYGRVDLPGGADIDGGVSDVCAVVLLPAEGEDGRGAAAP
jgi:hypothetical protein